MSHTHTNNTPIIFILFFLPVLIIIINVEKKILLIYSLCFTSDLVLRRFRLKSQHNNKPDIILNDAENKT